MTDPVRALADKAIPGRWEADDCSTTADVHYQICETLVGTIVADIFGDLHENKMIRSNARLIALAPDLARVAADLAGSLREIGILGCDHKKAGEGYTHNLSDCQRCRALAAYEQLQARAGGE